MKLIGSQYLHETLRYVIHRVIREKKACEIDTTRIREGQSLEENMANLTGYLDLVFKSIITSVMMCPQLMRDVFAILKELSQKYFREREVCYSVISGFIFLRFFAPAILNPKLFDITDQTVDPTVGRTLTLMSKTVQMLGNMVSSKLVSSRDELLLIKELTVCIAPRHAVWLSGPKSSHLQRRLYDDSAKMLH